MDNQLLIGNLSAFLERASRRLIERKTDELVRFGIEYAEILKTCMARTKISISLN